jgi:hypothetical protein
LNSCAQAILDTPYTSRLPKITIGVCAMDKKARSKEMAEILARLNAHREFEVVFFGNDTILHRHVEEWPRCECLLSWHSDGFPLAKVNPVSVCICSIKLNYLCLRIL